MDGFLLYNINKVSDVVAFTTKRSVGRDREAICRMLGIDDAHLVYPHQTHGTVVRQIGKEFIALSADTKKMILEGVDAVFTNVPGVCVAVSTADCIPVLVYDPEHHAAAAIHAGWRGTVAKIVRKTVEEMAMAYGTRPEALLCIIGPGISAGNFEVGEEVYAQFVEAGFPMEQIATRPGNAKPHLDLWTANRIELESTGVAPENIHVDGTCTFAHSDEYFSARHDGAATGRMLNGIIIHNA